MAKIVIYIRYIGRVSETRTESIRFEQELEVDQIDEATLRGLLERYEKEISSRPEYINTKWTQIHANDDIEELNRRRGVDLIDNNGVYLPNKVSCHNCGWYTNLNDYPNRKQEAEFCNNPDCRAAGVKYWKNVYELRLENRKASGKCTYYIGRDIPDGNDGYCANPVDNEEDQLCSYHLTFKCGICFEQAFYALWEFGSFAYEHARCAKHRYKWNR